MASKRDAFISRDLPARLQECDISPDAGACAYVLVHLRQLTAQAAVAFTSDDITRLRGLARTVRRYAERLEEAAALLDEQRT